MNRQQLTQTLIEAAVGQGLKDIRRDPARGVRRLADLGQQFATGRFQSQIFSLFQRLLADPNSPYYDAVQALLSRVEDDTIKRFGTNVGYNSWTYGASLLRKDPGAFALPHPWLIELTYSAKKNAALSLEEMRSLIAGNRPRGVYAYSLRVVGKLPADTALFSLFWEFPDCAFLLYLSEGELEPRLLEQLRRCPNLCLLLPAECPNTRPLAQALQRQKALYAIRVRYDEKNLHSLMQEQSIAKLLTLGSVFLLFAADPACDPKARQRMDAFLFSSRLSQKYPAILSEWDADVERVSRIISPDPARAAGIS